MESVSSLVRGEVDLAKLELRQAITRLSTGGGLFAGAALVALFSIAFLLTAIALALATIMAPWAAALVMALVLAILAGVLGMIGRKKVREAEIRPVAAIQEVKADIEAIRSGIEQRKEKRAND